VLVVNICPSACSIAVGIVARHLPEFAAAATLGLAVNFLSNLIIKTSSATTVKLLAAVRGPIVVLAGVLMFAETVSCSGGAASTVVMSSPVCENSLQFRAGV
jgi:hypothetical protein